MRKKVAIFGGTFDPIHFGHLNLVLQMQEIHGLHEVLFCPAALSPLKEGNPPWLSCAHRRKIVELAIEPIESFSLLDYEINRPGLLSPSYTVDTVRFLIQQAQQESVEKEFYLILGEDALENFSKWQEVHELIRLARPLAGTRAGFKMATGEQTGTQNALEIEVTKISVMEISSTTIRERLVRGLYCGHLLPAKVLDYIIENQLY